MTQEIPTNKEKLNDTHKQHTTDNNTFSDTSNTNTEHHDKTSESKETVSGVNTGKLDEHVNDKNESETEQKHQNIDLSKEVDTHVYKPADIHANNDLSAVEENETTHNVNNDTIQPAEGLSKDTKTNNNDLNDKDKGYHIVPMDEYPVEFKPNPDNDILNAEIPIDMIGKYLTQPHNINVLPDIDLEKTTSKQSNNSSGINFENTKNDNSGPAVSNENKDFNDFAENKNSDIKSTNKVDENDVEVTLPSKNDELAFVSKDDDNDDDDIPHPYNTMTNDLEVTLPSKNDELVFEPKNQGESTKKDSTEDDGNVEVSLPSKNDELAFASKNEDVTDKKDLTETDGDVGVSLPSKNDELAFEPKNLDLNDKKDSAETDGDVGVSLPSKNDELAFISKNDEDDEDKKISLKADNYAETSIPLKNSNVPLTLKNQDSDIFLPLQNNDDDGILPQITSESNKELPVDTNTEEQLKINSAIDSVPQNNNANIHNDKPQHLTNDAIQNNQDLNVFVSDSNTKTDKNMKNSVIDKNTILSTIEDKDNNTETNTEVNIVASHKTDVKDANSEILPKVDINKIDIKRNENNEVDSLKNKIEPKPILQESNLSHDNNKPVEPVKGKLVQQPPHQHHTQLPTENKTTTDEKTFNSEPKSNNNAEEIKTMALSSVIAEEKPSTSSNPNLNKIDEEPVLTPLATTSQVTDQSKATSSKRGSVKEKSSTGDQEKKKKSSKKCLIF